MRVASNYGSLRACERSLATCKKVPELLVFGTQVPYCL
jgi:hypothetical protein